MPREALALAAVSVVLAVGLDGFGGVMAAAMLGALTAGFTLSGLRRLTR